ncbi:MAG: MOSC domain-containing protein [Steroidobacterales bacterium]
MLRPSEFNIAVRIVSLHCYPLKSGRGLELEQAQLTPAGIAHDRRWMVVTPSGHFLTQRELPRLALIRPELSADELLLRAPARDELRIALRALGHRIQVMVWNDSCPAFDEGDAAASWLAAVLERECRLVRFDPEHRRLSARAWTGDIETENRFSDGFPLLVIGRASLADLNSRLPRALPMNRFRPNIVLEGLEPYGEDRVDELYDGPLRLKLVKPCTRCRITTTDQDTAALDGEEPLRTLKTYRYDTQLRGVIFGQNTIIIQGAGGTLRRGQSLQVRWKETTTQ